MRPLSVRVGARARLLAIINVVAFSAVAPPGCRCSGEGSDSATGPDGGADAGGDAAPTDSATDAGGPTYAASPIGLLATDTTLYVTGAAFDVTFAAGPGFVAAIDRATNAEIERATTSAPQPQFLALDSTNGALLVASSGVVDFSMFPVMFMSAAGALDVYPVTDLSVSTSVPLVLEAVPEPAGGGLGPIAAAVVAGGGVVVYGGSSLTGDLYAFDPTAGTVLRGPASPIAYFAPSVGFTGVHATSGGLVVTDFSTDEVCLDGDPDADLASTACINLRAAPGTPIGVQRVCDFSGAPDLYAIANLSGELLQILPGVNPGEYVVNRHDLGGFVDPQGLACGADGMVYVTLSFLQDRIARFDPMADTLDTAWLMLPAGSTPRDVVVTGPGTPVGYVAAIGNDTVIVFDPAAATITDTIAIAAP